MSVISQEKRLSIIGLAEEKNQNYCRRIRVESYLAGQAIYNLGDYPEKISARPTDYDHALLRQLAENGVELIQLHEEWNDANRLHGGNKFDAPDPEGLKEFIKECHSLGMKVIAYLSTGFFPFEDPDFREDFIRSYEGEPTLEPKRLWYTAHCLHYRKCTAGSPAWRTYLLDKIAHVMDDYGFDGIFNDWGYDKVALRPAIVDQLPYDPELEDFLRLTYSEVKRRGGIYKLHADRNNQPPCRDRVYDYLWIGEAVSQDADSVGVGKNYPTYVVPCMDMVNSENHLTFEQYIARTVPYLQFPLLKCGRPVRGENLELPGVTYYGGMEQNFYEKVRDYMREHPEGPYVYSLWSSIPDDPKEGEKWSYYYSLYRPMVTENSLVYVDVKESGFLGAPLPENTCMSVFANEELYMTLSNYGTDACRITLAESWQDRETGETGTVFSIASNGIRFLKKV
ncbi:MAG: hypothetical protein IJY47_03115 [Clostridia bacterium]|nr:hypothetical protein [Clostridia bacterium]